MQLHVKTMVIIIVPNGRLIHQTDDLYEILDWYEGKYQILKLKKIIKP